MSLYLFILGRNWRASIAEIACFLQRKKYLGNIRNFSKNSAVIEFKERVSDDQIVRLQELLGGTQKVAEVWGEIETDLVTRAFPFYKRAFKDIKKNRVEFETALKQHLVKLIPSQGQKLMFAVSVYPGEFSKPEANLQFLYPYLNNLIHSFLKENRIKNTFFKYPTRALQDGSINPIWPHNVRNYELTTSPNSELIFSFIDEHCHVCRTIAVDDPNLLKKIDEERPCPGFEFSTPPKLAKMQVNFTNIEHGQIFLDPFCGSGTHLMITALRGISFFGADIAPQMILKSCKNVEWLIRDQKLPEVPVHERFTCSDVKELSKHFSPASIHAIATEPYLGPALKQNLVKEKVIRLIQDELLPLYLTAFRTFWQLLVPDGRVSIITPVFHASDGSRIEVEISRPVREIGFKEVNLFPDHVFIKKSTLHDQLKPFFQKPGQKVSRRLNCFIKK
ncbi:MAG: TRM11 family SAM-dependent methyltransferase [Candidatus Helarchaeota archaeon]